MQFEISTAQPPPRDDLIQGAIKQAPSPWMGGCASTASRSPYNSEPLQRTKKFPIMSAGPVFLHLDPVNFDKKIRTAEQGRRSRLCRTICSTQQLEGAREPAQR
ncbi:hypothetical protein JCM10213v2_001657 [Rhodosporidiobolus nylandii]